MPANLPAEAKAKWKKVMDAKTPEEKIKALKDFLSSVPKHKGTEKLVMQVKRQIASLKREIILKKEKRRSKKAGFFVEKEGAAQISILGPPNSGKSTFLSRITNIELKASNMPFETQRPCPLMLIWQGVYFQLIDLPSVSLDGKSIVPLSQIMAVVRNSDGLILVIDKSFDPQFQFNFLTTILYEHQISITPLKVEVTIERRSYGGITVMGELKNTTIGEVEKLLRSYGIYHALIKIKGKATLDDIEERLFRKINYKPTFVVFTKQTTDLDEITRLKNILKEKKINFIDFELYKSEEYYKKIAFQIGLYFFNKLSLIRIYTKNPRSGEIAAKPLVLKKGVKVIDVAKIIHSRLYKNFRYAKLWRKNLKVSPIRVGADFILEDRDIIEIYAS